MTCVAHYWLIEAADGSTSKGTCKLCGVTRDFANSPEASGYSARNAQIVLTPPHSQVDYDIDAVIASNIKYSHGK